MAEALECDFPTITPHLVVKDAAAAIEFYKKAFGAKERFRLPWPGPDGVERIGHAEILIGDAVVMVNDEFPEYGAVAPSGQGASVTIHFQTPDVDATFARAVEAGATAAMPPENMFWGDRYGKLIDPFGHHWSIGTKVEDVSPEEMQKRIAEMKAAGDLGC